ncbi:MAG: hypothetical protein HY848_18345 [Betaproteobacteria bacterium]|nr:hypothetical protein [Betaproteobacteria bacterium]
MAEAAAMFDKIRDPRVAATLPDGPSLLMGLDEISMTQEYAARIAAFQAGVAAQRPWIYQNGFRLGAR